MTTASLEKNAPMLTSTWFGPSASNAIAIGAPQAASPTMAAMIACRQRSGAGGVRPSILVLTARSSGEARATRKPISAAAATISGKGRAKKKIPMKAASASPISSDVFSARLPMRISASTTITSTAALMPNSAPSTIENPRPSA